MEEVRNFDFNFCSRFLTGQKADTIENIIKGIEILHKSGCKIVVITSVEVDDSNEKLTVIASNSKFIITYLC